MLLFLTTNMAAVTSRASQQYFRSVAIQAVVRSAIVFVQVILLNLLKNTTAD